MKKLLWIAVLVIPLTAILFRSTSLRQLLPHTGGELQITGDFLPMVLYIDNRLIGTLPLDVVPLSVGVHTLSLRNVLGETESHVWWQEEVTVERGDSLQLILQAQDNQLTGAALVRLMHSSATVSRIFVQPSDSTVFFDEASYTGNPILLSEVMAGTNTVRVEHSVYPDMEFDIEVPVGTALEVRIKLFLDIVTTIQKQEGLVLEPALRESTIYRRWDWGAPSTPVPIDSLQTTEWKSLGVYQADTAIDASTEALLPMIERTFRERAVFVRIPFAFIVDTQGNIWEGLGLWDFDYSTVNVSVTTFQSGEAPVLVLGSSITEEQKRSLEHLLAFIQQEPVPSSQILDVPTTLTLQTEEIRTVSLQVKNTGWTVWEDSGDGQLRVQPQNTTQRSNFYHPDVWLAPDTVASLADPMVIPGADTTIPVTFKASAYPITTTETFILTQRGIELAQSAVSIQFVIEGSGIGIEIVDTPTGFLNVRAEASLGSELLGAVYPGERYVLLQSQGEWHQITLLDGTVGWVNGDYIRRL